MTTVTAGLLTWSRVLRRRNEVLGRVENDAGVLARTDDLTELLNRRGILEILDRMLPRGCGQRSTAVFIIDLDGFKEVNDSLGHQAGDDLLRQVAERFRSCLGADGVLGRLGGDEFGAIARIDSAEHALALGRRLSSSLIEPFEVDGMPVRIGASTGVSIAPEHGSDRSNLLRCADVAMYDAKRSQRDVAIYSVSHDPNSRDRLELIEDLRDAIRSRSLEMHYQPAIDLRTGEIVGVEALVRWRHPSRGLLFPDSFIPLAERVGLITLLTRSVIEQSVRFMATGPLPPHASTLRLSINVSGLDLSDETLPDFVRSQLVAHRFPASRLTLEVTETSLADDPERANRSIEALREDGVRVAIDDFGVGYSSMSQLLGMSFDELKIDRTFVAPLQRDPRARAIVRSTVQLARALQLTVVAEGVESRELQTMLAELGCDYAQGYSISRPLTPDQLHEFVRNYRTADASSGSLTN